MIGSSDVDLLLIGKTGNGKSATGNSILRRKAFTSKASSTSITLKVHYEFSQFNGRTIKVVDGPGVGDTRLNTEAAVNLVMTAMEYAISANPQGYHAFLLVVKFGGRFTAEDRDTIAFLKKIFGPDFVKHFCILVVTCGDLFEDESEENGMSFQEWCNQEKGDFKTLVMECNNRVVLFDNRTKDPAKKNKQIENLLNVVDNLSSRGKRYSDENFACAREARKRISVEVQKTIIEEKTMAEVSLILFSLQELRAKEDLRSKVEPLKKLLLRVESLLESLASQDQGTGALHDLRTSVESIHRNVSDEIQSCHRMIDEIEKATRREEEIRRKFEDDMKIQKEKYARQQDEHKRRLEEFEKQQDSVIAKLEEKSKQEKLEFEKQQNILIEKMEEQSKKEKHELDQKYKQRQDQMEKECDEIEKRYRQIKQKNDDDYLDAMVANVPWPLRIIFKFAGWVASLFD